MACMMLGPQGELRLSPQEYKVMCYLRAGFTVKDTAAEMDIAYPTAYRYYERVKDKLGTFTQEETIRQFSKLYRSTMGLAFAILKGCLEEDNYLLLRDFIRREFTGYVGEFPEKLPKISGIMTLSMTTSLAICGILGARVVEGSTPTPAPAGTPYLTPTPIPEFANVGTGLVILGGLLPLLGYVVALIVAIVLGYIAIRSMQRASKYFFGGAGR